MLVNIQPKPIKAATSIYINETSRVPVTINFPKPVAGFYHTSTGVSGAIGDPINEKYVSSTTITVALTPKTLGSHSFSITFDVADRDANDVPVAKKTVTVNVVNRPAPKSSNNYLTSLTTNVGTLRFNKNTSNYTLIVNHNVTSASINAKTEDNKATISGTGTKQLRVYGNTFTIKVTAENGAVRNYRLNIVRRDASGNAGALSKNNNLSSLHVEGCDIDFNKDVLEYRCEVDSLVDNVTVIANAEDPKASVDIGQLSSLSIGNNEIHIRVTAENEETKLYKLIVRRSGDAPLLYEMDLKKALETHSGSEIAIYDTGRLALDSLKLVQKHRKVLLVKRFDDHDNLRYIWRFEGNEVDALVDINTTIDFDGDEKLKINEITNYAHGLLLSFQYNPHLPLGTAVGVFVGDYFEEEQKVNVYYYDSEEQSLELKFQNLVVTEDFLWLPLEHTSDYFITPAHLEIDESTDQDMWKYLTLASGSLSLGLLLYTLFQRHQFKKYKKSNPQSLKGN